MRSRGQTSDVPVQHRKISFRIAFTVLLLMVGLSWLAKGSGLKTWLFARITRQKPANAHIDTIAALSAKVRLDSDPNVQFERIALPTASGAAFTCVRIGP